MLSAAQIEQFIEAGFVRVDDAFPRELAAVGRELLARDLGCSVDDASTWAQPVVRLGMYGQAPFREAANTRVLHEAFDQLVGVGRWKPRLALGTFPVRFPSAVAPADAGWHIDVTFGTENPDFMSWRANSTSKGRALLMLFLFSDVGDDDAPTRLLAGSHHDVARLLAPAGDHGLTLRELVAAGFGLDVRRPRPEVLATGPAGTVYLCHPFLVHAAQEHRGTRPRFMAQPGLEPAGQLSLEGTSPVERALRGS